MSKAVTVQIGNSDDKLKQFLWSDFIYAVDEEIRYRASRVHFQGFSEAMAAWQNAAWCFEISDDQIDKLKDKLAIAAADFNQDSIAWLEGETEFIAANKWWTPEGVK